MLALIQKIFGRENSTSKDIAKERLRLVLVHDRASVSPQIMEAMRDDLIKVISKYMEINEHDMEFSLTSDKSAVALIANIPVQRMKR